MTERFLRNEMMLGPAAVERLAACRVCVVGLGGVGSGAVEVLARAGVGELTLIDQDVYGESNVNRQLGALTSTLGQPKAEVLARRVLEINPDCTVRPIVGKYTKEDRERFFGPYDCIVDAIDLVACKVDLICQAMERGIPILSALGTGSKLDPSRLEVTDLSKTCGCPQWQVWCEVAATGCHTRRESQRRRHRTERTNCRCPRSHEDGEQHQCRQGR